MLDLPEAVPERQELVLLAEDCTQVLLVEAHKQELQAVVPRPLAVLHTLVVAEAELQPRRTHLEAVAAEARREHKRERRLNMVVAVAEVPVLQAVVVAAARRLTESLPMELNTDQRSHTETGPVIARERRICNKIKGIVALMNTYAQADLQES